jgi:RNA polymerase sigma factor (sigma-70 family)
MDKNWGEQTKVGVDTEMGIVSSLAAPSHQEVDIILDNLNQAVIRFDCQMGILWANKAGYDYVEEFPEWSGGLGCGDFSDNDEKYYFGWSAYKAIQTTKLHKTIAVSSKNRIWQVQSHPLFDCEKKIDGAIEIASPLDTANTDNERITEFNNALFTLTAREKQVMNLVAEGKTNREIAEELFLSPKTVEIHRSRMMRKLKVDSLAYLVRYLTKLGLI